MQDITKSSYSTYNINNYTNILNSIDIIQYLYISSKYNINNYTNILNSIDIIQYPYISSKYTILYDYTKSLLSQYGIKYSTQSDINFKYLINVDNIQYIKELYTISHLYYNILSKYLIQNNFISTVIDSLYKIYNDTYILSIDSEYRITHNIIIQKYNIMVNKILPFNIKYLISSNIFTSIYSNNKIKTEKTSYIKQIYTELKNYNIIDISKYQINIPNNIYIVSKYQYLINNILLSINKYYIINDIILNILSTYNIVYTIKIISKYILKFNHILNINSNYEIIHSRFIGKYVILNNTYTNILNKYKIILNYIKNINVKYQIYNEQQINIKYKIIFQYLNKINSKYSILNNSKFQSLYFIQHVYEPNIISTYSLLSINEQLFSKYLISVNKILDINIKYNILNTNFKNIQIIYNILTSNFIISKYNLLTFKTNNIMLKYQLQNRKSIFSTYFQSKLNNLTISTIYNIQQISNRNITSSYNILKIILNYISNIQISKDKYQYNKNNTGLILKIDYNSKIISTLSNLKYVITLLPLQDIMIKNNIYHYDTQFNSNNINLQFIIDNFGNKKYIYQVPETTDLSTTQQNKFILIPNQNGTYQFKTNYKFSSNNEYYPYKIYLLSQIQIQYSISNSFNQKQIKKLYLIQDNPGYNSTINITCNNKYIKLQKDYNINEKYYQLPTNQLIFTIEEQQNYYNSFTNRMEIPVKIIIYKKYIKENSILVPLIIDIN